MTDRATSPVTADRTAPCWSTSSTPTSHWRRELGRDDFEYGQFGENFTVEGLPDDEVCIGDRYEIGGALFEVSQPRVTCYRVGLRLGEPRLPALLVAHRRPGFYLRVLREGTVEAGDPIVRVRHGPERMTVAESRRAAVPARPRPCGVARALRITGAEPGLAGSFEAMLRTGQRTRPATPGSTRPRPHPPPAWSGFRPITGRRASIRESDTVVSLRLATADGQALPAALPGSSSRCASGSPPVSRHHPQLFAVRRAGLARVPGQREARTRRGGQHGSCTRASAPARSWRWRPRAAASP